MKRWFFYIVVAMGFANLAAATTVPANYTYDALGRRTSATINDLTRGENRDISH